MNSIRLLLFCTIALVLPVSAWGQWSTDPSVNNPVCATTGSQERAQILPDGQGGAFLVWSDTRSGDYRLYAQRLDADGNPLWGTTGIRVCTYESTQIYFDVATDMADGLFVVWKDEYASGVDIYSQRIGPSGTLYWSGGGVPVCSAVNDQTSPRIDSDGQSGFVAAWWDKRTDSGDIYAQRMDANGAALWTAEGVAVCTETDLQYGPSVLSDSGGGVTVAWADTRGTGQVIYARRVNYLGTPIWNAGGNLVADGVNDAFGVRIVSDGSQGYLISFYDESATTTYMAPKMQRLNAAGARLWQDEGVQAGPFEMDSVVHSSLISDPNGGAFLAWTIETDGQLDLKGQRVDPNGALIWGSSGRTICDAVGDQYDVNLALDGQGGVFANWLDCRTEGDTDTRSVYAQRLDVYGNELWNHQGNIVQRGSAYGLVSIASDDRGGMISAWSDSRSAAPDLYAQRVDDTGYLGDPDPRLDAVVDLPNDQGGQVNLHWTAGYVDAMPWYAVETYSAWMRQPEAKSAAAPMAPDELAKLSQQLGSAPEVLTAMATAGWTLVGQVPAMLRTEYGCLAPSYGDSTAGDPNPTEYCVVAHGSDPWLTWESAVMVGYSIDNLAPAAPQNLDGEWTAFAEATLSWNPGPETDLNRYRVYRNAESGFVPTEDDLLGSPTETTFLDAVPGGSWYYRVTAVDVHGNEGTASGELCMTSASAVSETAPNAVALHANFPNPFNPVTRIRFDLPEAMRIDLAVFSVDGARVATLRSGTFPAGRHDVQWRGTDDAGRAQPSGVYLFRLDAGRHSRTRSMTLVR